MPPIAAEVELYAVCERRSTQVYVEECAPTIILSIAAAVHHKLEVSIYCHYLLELVHNRICSELVHTTGEL